MEVLFVDVVKKGTKKEPEIDTATRFFWSKADVSSKRTKMLVPDALMEEGGYGVKGGMLPTTVLCSGKGSVLRWGRIDEADAKNTEL